MTTSPSPAPNFSLKAVLLERNLITPEKLAAAELEQSVTKERLGKVLVRNGFVRQTTILDILLEFDPNQLHEEALFDTLIPAQLLIDTKSMIAASVGTSLHISTLSHPAVVEQAFEPYVRGWDLVFTSVNPERLREYHAQLIRTSGVGGRFSWEQVLQDAMSKKASDIHILPRQVSYTIKTRIDGVLHLTHEGPMEEYIALMARIKDLSRMDMAEKRRPQDGGFSIDHAGRVVSFRVVTVPTIDGERMVIRILDGEAQNMDLNGLGITEIDVWRNITLRPDGLCLICGPTGSGKTTTLASTVREMNFLERAIYSIEDPVEHRLPYAGQVNINPSIELDFASGVRNFMRADPDVIIVGEVREEDTARNALKAAETGHLAIATLHTGSITNAITRLRDIGIEPYELRHLLRGVMVQRLMRVYCLACNGKGCDICNDSGYKGREVISEVVQLRNEHDVDRVINGEVFWNTLLEDARDKVVAGRTSESELIRVFGVRLDEVDDEVRAAKGGK